MTKQEKDYAIDRIRRVVDRKEAEIKKKHTIKGFELTTQKKIELIYSYAPPPMKPKPERICYDPNLTTCYDFSGYIETEDVIDLEAIEAKTEHLHKKAQNLKDEIMLGSAPEALKLMREFFAELEKE